MAAPAKPTLTLTAIGSTTATVGASYPDPYVVYGTEWQRKVAGGSFATIYSGDSGSRYSMPQTDLTDGTSYVWRMRSYNSSSEYSAYSDEITGTTTLPAPDGMGYTAGPTTCQIRWRDNSQNESGFRIYRTGSGGVTFNLLATVGANVTYYDDSGLTAGQYYKYYVLAYNGTCISADSPTVNVFTADPPNSPGALILTVTGTTTMRAAWTDNADNEEGFTVEWGTDGVAFGSSGTVGANVTSYTIIGLTSNTLYYVRVKATNGSGSSAYSSTAAASTLAAIAQPTGLTVTPWGSGALDIIFQDNSSLEDSHEVEYRIQGLSAEKITDVGLETWNANSSVDTYPTAGTFTWTAPAGVTSVQVEAWGGGGGGGGSDMGTSGGGGGGGAYSKKNSLAVTPGNGYTVIVGAAGTTGDQGASGGAGGDSSFKSTSDVLAKGGNGGGGDGSAGGTGGASASGVGDTKYSGGNGVNGSASSPGGGGGASAGTGANGGNASGSTRGTGPSGGADGGDGGAMNNNGSGGTAPGGAGGGGGYRNTTKTNGGAGAAGKVIVTYSGTPVTLTNWTKTLGGTSTLSRGTDVHGGSYSAKFVVDGSNNNAYIAQSVTLAASESHQIRIWYKTEAGKTLFLQLISGDGLSYLQSNGTWAGSGYIALSASTAWTSYTLTFTTPAKTSFAMYVGHYSSYSSQTSATFYLDDASILGSASFGSMVSLEPNRTFYRKTGLTAGASYDVRVRARQGASYSAYSSTVSATTLSAPAAPTNLAISEYQDTWLRLTWTKTAGEASYEVYKSTDGTNYTKITTLDKGIEYYKVKSLTASTLYYFKILAKNAAGSSAYTSVVSQTTRALYQRSKFENLCLMTKQTILYPIEISPRMVLAGWNLTAGKSYTYEYAITDAGLDFSAVAENGVALIMKASTAEVEATTGSFYCDYSGRKLYVHAAAGSNPADFLYVGTFTLYVTTYQDGTISYNGKQYLPLVPADGVPGISASLSPAWEGGLTINAGSITLANPKLKKTWAWDQAFSRFIWTNAKVKILAGGVGFAYSELYSWATGTVTEDYELNDSRLTLPLRDSRDALAGQTLPKDIYTADEFPLADTNILWQRRPFGFGAITGALPPCIDTTNRVFEFHAGRCKSVEAVRQNGVTLTAGTDYFTDLQRGRVTLARGLAYATSDRIEVDFTGQVDDNDTAIKNGALIFLYGLRNFAGLPLAEIDLDSIYTTAEGSSVDLAFHIFKETDFGSFAGRLERSLRAFTYQDGLGRIGLKTSPTAAQSGILYVGEQYISAFSMKGGKDSRYRQVQVKYGESQATESFISAISTLNTMTWKYNVQGTLEVETALATLADANTLKSQIVNALDRPEIYITIKRRLYTAEVGDMLYVSRARYYSAAGTANNKLLRITKIDKGTAGEISIRAEGV